MIESKSFITFDCVHVYEAVTNDDDTLHCATKRSSRVLEKRSFMLECNNITLNTQGRHCNYQREPEPDDGVGDKQAENVFVDQCSVERLRLS